MMNLARSRVVWLAAGSAWAANGLVFLNDPRYWDPVTALDWAAVWSYSAGLLLLAPSILLLARLTPIRPVVATAASVAGGVVVAGTANALEDGLGMKALGTAYIAGILLGWLALIAMALVQLRIGFARLAALSGVIFAGLALVSVGGGLIVATSLGSLAAKPHWFIRASSNRQPVPDATATPDVPGS